MSMAKRIAESRLIWIEEPLWGIPPKVNWAAIGAQTPRDAETFARALLRAAAEARTLKKRRR